MYWAFDNVKSQEAGAHPPLPLELAYGRPPEGDNHLRGLDLQRAFTLTGREVRPSDCGPVRVISRLGHAVRAPGRIVIQREDPPQRWRDFQNASCSYGAVRVAGDPWHGTESGFVASWIAGSRFVKISTGILVFFPKGNLLYQGPVPNRHLIDDPALAPAELDVMAAAEYANPQRSRLIDGSTYGIAALNIIARTPDNGSAVEVQAGQIIGWFHLLAPPAEQALEPLPEHEVSGE